MSIAIVATLTSLFAIAWPAHVNRPASPAGQSSASVATLPDVLLTDSTGRQFRARESLPALILLVDGCGCADLIRASATAVEASTSVLVVGHQLPTLPDGLPTGRRVSAAADPADALRTAYPGSGTAAVLAARNGAVVAVLHDVTTADSFRAYLSELG